MGNLYVLLRYSLILGLLTRRINRYVCGRVFMIERCVPPSQWALLCQRSCCLGDYVCHRVKQVHYVKQALGDSKSLPLRRLNPASQLCFAWLCPLIVETNNEGPTWHICLLTLSFTSICTLRTTLSCYMSAHCWICICGTSGKAQCRDCSKAGRDCSKAEGRMKLIWFWGFTWTRSIKNLCFLNFLNLFSFKHVSRVSFRSFKYLHR